MYNYSALNQYQSVGIQSKVSASSPHSLVAMLLDGVLEKLAKATGFIERGATAEQGQAISSTIRIIDSLRASLDMAKGGEIASGLASLYDYMERRLVEANINSDAKIIEEVVSLIGQIKSGWDAIPDNLRGA
ncbi:MAG: flagellar export chaperone FliS [SAR86 cluster bacterium]|uniref:Flagellar secretion chaperone FliS n=1 Tax=SAR86 cluster bacterium TaxID=2030880 RepID=A0A2A5B536_9GAMM|nr:MAG: flagellar export chaperone FliS [SAR86 cluster bacterium]